MFSIGIAGRAYIEERVGTVNPSADGLTVGFSHRHEPTVRKALTVATTLPLNTNADLPIRSALLAQIQIWLSVQSLDPE
jgi:hypothetical protein